MATDYDAIADQSRRSKVSPTRTYIEKYTFLDVLGDRPASRCWTWPAAEASTDACPRPRGETRVLGVELSAGTLKMARSTQPERPLVIHHVLGDAREFRLRRSFDVVASALAMERNEKWLAKRYVDAVDTILNPCIVNPLAA